ncbi:FkbM family methyltransferase [Gemmata sp. G18]|uniref:FkbM family methyltransferase n=1 Tax=Gemmata palustris TaxID=2822762 RepID=A0ABS5C1V8_9BACT|nr:FkbM family methyltransferase [Gemmata palustris]MBP3959951.1 FkbM family methyltransferase [Gemmata palustris]
MPNVSYAQNREDVLLNRVFPGTVGFYIDIGAADPVELSVTKWFYDRGWNGINIEPQAGYFAALSAARPRDINVNALLSDARHDVTFYEFPDRPLLSTPDAALAAEFKKAGVPVISRTLQAVTLAEVCERYVRGPIDFLKIDVEGHELSVLRGADFSRWRPVVLVIEATESERSTPNHGPWEPLVLAADYLFATFDGLNRYYVRAEDAHLVPRLQLPINLFDEPYVPAERLAERAMWDAERAAWAAERVMWTTERAGWVARVEEQAADRVAERTLWAAERADLLERVRWLDGQLHLYRAA